jgi:hypothetical protein
VDGIFYLINIFARWYTRAMKTLIHSVSRLSHWRQSVQKFFGMGALFLSLGGVFALGAMAQTSYPNPLEVDGTPVTDLNILLTAFLSNLQGLVVVLALVFIIVGALIYITSAGNEQRMTWAKTAILVALIGLAIAIAAPLFLRELGLILGWTPTTPAGVGTTLTLSQVLGNVLSFLLAVLGVVALLALILWAFLYLTAAGEPDRADTGKKIITYAIIGIVVALAGLVIITQVAKFFV